MIVVFDGFCVVCNGFVAFLARRDRRRGFVFVPAASDEGRRWLAACGERNDDPATMIVVADGVPLLRSDAVIAAVAALSGVWRTIGIAAIVPRPLRDAMYNGFARRRYRWFGRASACALCDPSGPEAS